MAVTIKPAVDLRVLSLGAGVQSSTLALMIKHEEVPMVDCAILEYDHQDTDQARKDELFQLITCSLQQHTDGNQNELLIELRDIHEIYDGLASFAKTSDTQHDTTGGHSGDNDDNNASDNDNND